MRMASLALLATAVLGSSLAIAQSPAPPGHAVATQAVLPAPSPYNAPQIAVAPDSPTPWQVGAEGVFISDPACCPHECWDPSSRFYARAEYLLWWTKGQHLPPLVTTGAPEDEFPGALGQPGTITLFGDATVDDQIRSGFQFTAGYWLDSDQVLGLEASVFYLEPHGTQFT